MKRTRIAVLFLLVIILVSGVACQGIGTDVLSCMPNLCLWCGKYVQQGNPSNYIELYDDNAAYIYEGGIGTHGTWIFDNTGPTIVMNWQGLRPEIRVKPHGNTLTDQYGVRWVRQ